MITPESDIQIHALRVERRCGRTGPPGRATAALACLWLVALASCDAMKSEQSRRDFRDDLVTEMCAPGAFYAECWYSGVKQCHEFLPEYLDVSILETSERVRPTEALRQQTFYRLFYYESVYLSFTVSPAFEKEECMDEKRWKHLPPDSVGFMAKLRAKREESKRKRREAGSATETTAPAPSPAQSEETAPEPSSPEPASGPDPASAP